MTDILDESPLSLFAPTPPSWPTNHEGEFSSYRLHRDMPEARPPPTTVKTAPSFSAASTFIAETAKC